MSVSVEENIVTPAYVFDLNVLIKRTQSVQSKLAPNTRLCYAIKANPFIIEALNDYVNYFEVCSFGEFKICENSTIDLSKIIVSGVYKKMEELDYIVSRYKEAVIYTIESSNQWLLLQLLAEKYHVKLPVLIRLSSGNQFGIDENELLNLFEVNRNQELVDILGIHYFSGTQKRSFSKYATDLQRLMGLIEKIEAMYGIQQLRIEYGPGLPVDYFGENLEIEEDAITHLTEAIKALDFKGIITLELGRYLTASCGEYHTKVVDAKKVMDNNYCIVDGGIHQVNYFGQNMAMKTPGIQKRGSTKGKVEKWTIAGSLCTSNDILAQNVEFNNLKIGDIVVFEKTGAYSPTEGISLFLSRALPGIYFKTTSRELKKVRLPMDTYTINSIKKETLFNG